ncbi:hypothetical protein QYF36_015284 [Acer negundo]|nr:hypothetical protein QYF36_015284 [Acer negundo]
MALSLIPSSSSSSSNTPQFNRKEANKVHFSEALEFDFTELSKVEQLWNGVQHHAKLKEINLGFSGITICPDISGFPNLERLELESCKYLHEISSSIQDHDKLEYLDISSCSNLEILPEMPQVVDGSSPISEDEDVLSLENAHDNCEEEDELIKVPDPGQHTTPRTSDTEGPTVGTSDAKGSEPEARSGTPVRHRRVRFALPRQPPTGDNSRGGVGGHTENYWDCKFADVIDDVRDLREDLGATVQARQRRDKFSIFRIMWLGLVENVEIILRIPGYCLVALAQQELYVLGVMDLCNETSFTCADITNLKGGFRAKDLFFGAAGTDIREECTKNITPPIRIANVPFKCLFKTFSSHVVPAMS